MKKTLKISAIVIVAVIAIFLAIPSNHYIVNALIHQKPRIDNHEIFSNRAIAAGNFQEWRIAKGYNSYNYSKDQLDYLTSLNTVAFLVIKDTSILSETYWGGYSKDSYSNSFSMAKSIVGLLIGCAVQDGYIKSIDQPVGDFLPEYKEGNKSKITLRNLLAMSSGLSWDEAYSSLFSVTTQGYYGGTLKRLVLNLKAIDEPGKTFNYRSGDSQLLALVVEAATGKKVSEYASERIWKPIGAEHEALWSTDSKNGTEKAFCCFNSNVRDFARIGQLMLNGGKWNGTQLIPDWYAKEVTKPVTNLFDTDLNHPNNRYGLQWWCLNYKNYSIFYARGILGQYIFVIPELNAVFVRLGHKRSDTKIDGHPEDVYKYIDFGLDVVNSSVGK